MKPGVATVPESEDLISHKVSLDHISEAVFRMGTSGKEVYLVKEKGRWVVQSHYGISANETVLSTFLDKLDKLDGELRSNDSALLRDYGISDEEAVHIILKQNSSEMSHLVLGNKKAGYQNNFVRKNGSNAVYLVDQNLLSDLGFWQDVTEENFNIDRWQDKYPLRSRLVRDNILEIKVIGAEEGNNFIVKKNAKEDSSEEWTTPEGELIEVDKVNEVINNFKNFMVTAIDKQEISVENALTAEFVQGERVESYTVTKNISLDAGQNCHLLRINADTREYCISKEAVADLKEAIKKEEVEMQGLEKQEVEMQDVEP